MCNGTLSDVISGAWFRASAVVLAAAELVHAQAPIPIAPITIDYAAPDPCPDAISLRAGVIARLGHDPFVDVGDQIVRHARVRIDRVREGFVGVIELQEPERAPSQRTIRPAARCDDAAAALELALAVVIDPRLAPPTPSYEPPRPVVPPIARYEPPGWRAPPPAEPRRKSELALALGSITGAHPESAFSVALRAGFQFAPHARIGMVGRLAIDQGDLDSIRTHRTSIHEVAAEGCAQRWYAMACAVAGFGTKSVKIERHDPMFLVETVADYSEPYALLGAAFALDVPLGNVFLRPGFELAAGLPAVPIESEGVERAEVSTLRFGFDLALGYRW